MLRTAWPGAGVAAVLLVVACGDGAPVDATGPACRGVSPATLEMDQTPAGQCPSPPKNLTGTGASGTPCSQAADCAPVCCTCPGAGVSADVAECSNGDCLDGATACCLYALQCAQ